MKCAKPCFYCVRVPFVDSAAVQLWLEYLLLAAVVLWHHVGSLYWWRGFHRTSKTGHIQHCEIVILAFIRGSFLSTAAPLTQRLLSCTRYCFQWPKGITMKIKWYERYTHTDRLTHVHMQTCTIQNKRPRPLAKTTSRNCGTSACSLVLLGEECVCVSGIMEKNQTMVPWNIAAKWKQ